MTTNWRWFRYDEIFDIKKGFYNKNQRRVEMAQFHLLEPQSPIMV